jgi:thioredoxin 1
MGKEAKLLLIAAVAAVALGFGLSRPAGPSPAVTQAVTAQPLPRLVDLGAGTCLPCKAMAPILEGLRTECAGRMEVQFMDVWKDPDAARPFGIRIISTQIFYGADGKELARHQGFMDKDAILAQWKAVGVKL